MADDAPVLNEGQKRALEVFNELWNDSSEAGRLLRAKAKEKYPETKLPEEAAEPLVAPLRAELEAMRAEREAERAERKAEKEEADQAKAQANLDSMLTNARNRYNLTDDGFDKMVARMKEQNNYTDADAAAAWVAQQAPKPTAPGPYLGPQDINLFGSSEKNEAFELLHRDPMGKFLDNEFREFTADPDKYVREAGFA
jgi:hypothetical protein